MRFFKTSNASRTYNTAGFNFSFDPIEQVGGVWLGLLAVEDDFTASNLAKAAIPQIKEITLEDYEALKKKPLATQSSFIESRPSPAQYPPQAVIVEPAKRVPLSETPKKEAPAEKLVEITSAIVTPPVELELTEVKPVKKKK